MESVLNDRAVLCFSKEEFAVCDELGVGHYDGNNIITDKYLNTIIAIFLKLVLSY